MNGDISGCFFLNLSTFSLLLLDEGLFLLLHLLGGSGLGLNSFLVDQSVIKLGSVDPVVILQEVVDRVSSLKGILLVLINLAKFASGHLLGSPNTLHSGVHIFIVVKGGASENGLVLLGSSANHISNLNLVEIA